MIARPWESPEVLRTTITVLQRQNEMLTSRLAAVEDEWRSVTNDAFDALPDAAQGETLADKIRWVVERL